MEVKVVRKQPTDDNLQHGFKYIKKKKVNGKWRYYYDVKDALGYDERAARDKAAVAYEKAKKDRKNYENYKTDANNKIADRRLKKDGSGYRPKTEYEKYLTSEREKESDRFQQKVRDAGKAYSKADDTYKKTALGKIESAKNYADYVKEDVSYKAKKTIKQAKKQIKKGKKFLSKLFK